MSEGEHGSERIGAGVSAGVSMNKRGSERG